MPVVVFFVALFAINVCELMYSLLVGNPEDALWWMRFGYSVSVYAVSALLLLSAEMAGANVHAALKRLLLVVAASLAVLALNPMGSSRNSINRLFG